MKLIQMLFSLSLLIFLHEGGHYLAARWCKTRVEKFYLFFDFLFPIPTILNFSLFKFKKGDTEYGLGWFPLGGYVKIAGMVDETTDLDSLPAEPQPWEFRSKTPLQRLFIMLGGIIVNLITGVVIYSWIFGHYGEQYLTLENMKYGVVASDLAKSVGFQDGDRLIGFDGKKCTDESDIKKAMIFENIKTIEVERAGAITAIPFATDAKNKLISGAGKNGKDLFSLAYPIIIDDIQKGSALLDAKAQKGDQIIAINQTPVPFFAQLPAVLLANKGKEVQVKILRNGTEMMLTSKVNDGGKLGFSAVTPDKLMKFDFKKYGFLEAIQKGFTHSWEVITSYLKGLALLFQPSSGAHKGLGSFGTFMQQFSPVWDWQIVWERTAMISLILAIMNLLPIPMLDGGYVIFTLWEMITGKKVSDKIIEKANGVGMILLMSMMAYGIFNDFIYGRFSF